MAFDETCRIIANEEVAPGYKFMTLEAPRLAAALVPGQFVHLRIPRLEPSALRRPVSVFDADDGKVSILYKQVGRGTTAMGQMAVGEEMAVMGPMGTGFPVKCGGVPLLIGGGYGVAPLYFLAKRMMAAGIAEKPVLFIGGRSAGDLLVPEKFRELGVEVHLATNDGSAGVKGFVVNPLDEVVADLQSQGKTFEFYVCGPDGLLKAVSQRAIDSASKGWISMDRHMICGLGACYACIQKIRLPNGNVFNARCCVNGPVFAAKDIVWE